MGSTRQRVQWAAGAVAAVALAAIPLGCDKDDDDETVLIPIDPPPDTTVTQDSVPLDMDGGNYEDYDGGSEDPSDPQQSNKKKVGGSQKKDAGGKKEEDNQGCLQKCSAEFSQCMSSRPDGGLFGIPNPTRCQSAFSACQKACGG